MRSVVIYDRSDFSCMQDFSGERNVRRLAKDISHIFRETRMSLSVRGEMMLEGRLVQGWCRAGLPETNWDLTSQYTPKNGNMGFKHRRERFETEL
jgi:hypothetical protein